jgi:hypothetical protein
MALADHKNVQERRTGARRLREELPKAYGQFLAGLAPWSWFVNPITFRGDAPYSDPAVVAVEEWLADVEAHAGKPIGWVIAEEFGALGGRWHCHGLICGTSHLERQFWWAEAFRRFGRTRIEPFDQGRAGAFYAAKYAAKTLGRIHFGGTLANVELSRVVRPDGVRRAWADSLAESSKSIRTHGLVAQSANLQRSFFRLGLGRWHR